MFSLLLLRISPLSHPAGRQGTPDLTLHIASQKEGLSPLTPRPQAESCTSGTLWRVFEAPQEPPLPVPTVPAPSQDPCQHPPPPPRAWGCWEPRAPPIPNPFTIPEQGGTHPLGDL